MSRLIAILCHRDPVRQDERNSLRDADPLGSGGPGRRRAGLARVSGERSLFERHNRQALGVPGGEPKDPGTWFHASPRLYGRASGSNEGGRRESPVHPSTAAWAGQRPVKTFLVRPPCAWIRQADAPLWGQEQQQQSSQIYIFRVSGFDGKPSRGLPHSFVCCGRCSSARHSV